MDIRRLNLGDGQTATLMDNDCLRCVMEDRGSVGVEFSAVNSLGGRENCAALPPFRGLASPVPGGSFFSFPSFPPASSGADGDGHTAASFWSVRRYGTDSPSGGIWVLSTLRNRQARYEVRKVDMLLPSQSVRYTAVSITNRGCGDLLGNAAWSNGLGSPFLATGCVLNTSASTWMTEPERPDDGVKRSFAASVQFEDLSHIPLACGSFADYTVVPPPNGRTDFISGRVPREDTLGWSSVINPRQQMVAFSFFPGPLGMEEGDLSINFINYEFNYGGRSRTPFAFYDGGTSQSFSLDSGAGTNLLSLGLPASLEKPSLMGADTLVTIKSGQTRTMYYAMAFQRFENPRVGLNFFSVERTEGGLLLKRTKSWAFIPSDPEFVAIRKVVKSLGAE